MRPASHYSPKVGITLIGAAVEGAESVDSASFSLLHFADMAAEAGEGTLVLLDPDLSLKDILAEPAAGVSITVPQACDLIGSAPRSGNP